MANNTERPRLLEIAEHLNRYNVEFIVIGGQAAVIHGSPLATFDVDICYRRTEENLTALAAALRALNPSLSGAPSDLPFRIDAQSLALGANFTLNTNQGPLDLLGWVEPIGDFEALLPGADEIEIEGLRFMIIGLHDLIAVKRHLGRPKDRAMLAQLESLRDMRNEDDG